MRQDTADLVKNLIEVEMIDDDSFLKIRETLTRIGLRSKTTQDGKPTLYQSCHILHKRGKFYIVHFKELFKLDGKYSSLSGEDIMRRNIVARLLERWGLLNIVDDDKIPAGIDVIIDDYMSNGRILALSHKEKDRWNLETKYNIGKYKKG